MNIRSIRNSVTSNMGLTLLKGKKHSPAIMFGAGVVGVVATVVLASRATLKLEAVLDEANHDLKRADAAHELDPQVYSARDYQQDRAVTYVKAVTKVARLYGPALLVGCASIGLLTGAHVTLTRRNASLTAAYIAVDKAFKEFSERVKAEYGEEKERELRFGAQEVEILSETKEGEPIVERVKVFGGHSQYARIFDEYNVNWEREPAHNIFFLKSKQQWLNDKLEVDGFVLLNDVYVELGMERTKAGCVVGWVKGHGDSHIDFGIWDSEDMDRFHAFMVGREKGILLDFNVDGVIYDMI